MPRTVSAKLATVNQEKQNKFENKHFKSAHQVLIQLFLVGVADDSKTVQKTVNLRNLGVDGKVDRKLRERLVMTVGAGNE